MQVEDSKGECNLGQHEINFRYGPALRKADEHAIYKNAAKEIAAQQGCAITYMAKFDQREGSSCHIHFSLLSAADGAPIFPADEALFERFIAGQLACLRELTLFFAPNINSYKRFARARSRRPPSPGARTTGRARSASSATAPDCASRTACRAPTSTPTSRWRR